MIASELARRVIEAYRSENGLRDLFGRNEGTVTVTTINERHVFGSNSISPTYAAIDRTEADIIRNRFVAANPGDDVGNLGGMPNNAFYHAETTVLLRAARQNGGTLEGRSLEVFSDRPMCNNCRKILPFVGQQVGNPTVTFVGPSNQRSTMRDGAWMEEKRQ